MVGDRLVAQQDDNPFGMGAHQNHPAGGARIDAPFAKADCRRCFKPVSARQPVTRRGEDNVYVVQIHVPEQKHDESERRCDGIQLTTIAKVLPDDRRLALWKILARC